MLPCVTPCVVAAVRRVKDGGGENEPGLSCTRSRHEKDDDKKDKKEVETVLISTICSSTWTIYITTLEM